MTGTSTSGGDRVVDLVARVLGLPVREVGADGAIGVTAGWDSLAQLNILTVVEQEFGLLIEPEDAVDLLSVADLVAYVARHGAA